jgi:hypothetical protein
MATYLAINANPSYVVLPSEVNCTVTAVPTAPVTFITPEPLNVPKEAPPVPTPLKILT